MLKDIQHRVDGMEAGAPLSTGATHRREQEQNQTTHCDFYEDYADNEGEEQWFNTYACKKTTETGDVPC